MTQFRVFAVCFHSAVLFIIQAVNIRLHLAFQRRVARHISRLSILHTQGRNCEHNYDDCLLNPCPEAFSCVDGVNKVSCLPPVTDPVPSATAVENITRGSTPGAQTPTLSPAPTAEPSTGTDHAVRACKYIYWVVEVDLMLCCANPRKEMYSRPLHLFDSYNCWLLSRLRHKN